MALFLSEKDVAPLVDAAEAVDVLERGFRGLLKPPAANLTRRRLPWGRDSRQTYVLGGVTPEGKTIAVRMATLGCNYQMLFSEQAGGLAAVIDNLPLSRARTGAATGVATKYLARENARSVGIVGTGSMAPMQLECICAVRRIEEIKAFSRDQGKLADFCQRMTRELGVPVKAAKSVEGAVRDVDIVVTLTSAKEPIVFGDWLSPGVHLNAVGANEISRRELDDSAVLEANLLVIDNREQGKVEARALVEAVAAKQLDWANVLELAEVVQPSGVRRSTDEQRTLFYSLGIGYEDAIYAEHILAKAQASGVGEHFGPRT